jgi:hypothetical protein
VFEVPERFLEAWQGAIRQRRAAGIVEVLELSSLTAQQLSGLDCLRAPHTWTIGAGLGGSRLADSLKRFRESDMPARRLLLRESVVGIPDLPSGSDYGTSTSTRVLDSPKPPGLRVWYDGRHDTASGLPITRVRLYLTGTFRGRSIMTEHNLPIPDQWPLFRQ